MWFWDSKLWRANLYSLQARLHWNTFSFIVCTTSWIFAVAERVFLSKKKKFFCYYCGFCFLLAKPPKRLELAVPDISNQDLITFNKVVLSLGQILGFVGRAWCPYLAWSWCIHSLSLWLFCTGLSSSEGNWSLPNGWYSTWQPEAYLKVSLTARFSSYASFWLFLLQQQK